LCMNFLSNTGEEGDWNESVYAPRHYGFSRCPGFARDISSLGLE
jgi:hypothetical protein